MNRQFHVRLIARGVEYDVTRRTEAIGQITEDLEEDLLQLTYSDLTVKFFDDDGEIGALFERARRGEIFELIVERETGRRRPKWERVFAGVADIPGSVRTDEKNNEISVQFFSYGKLLELFDAGVLKRDIGTRTGTVSAGSKSVTVSSSTDLVAGDKISLRNSSGVSEEQTIETIVSATSVSTVSAWATAFTGATLILETQYYRGKTVQWLTEQLFALAGFGLPSVDISADLVRIPFPSDMNSQGLPAGCPDSLLEYQGKLRAYMGGKRYEADNLTTGFGAGTTDTAKMDWQPYVLTEPGTLRPTGPTKYDYSTGDYYSLGEETNGDQIELWLYKNGAALVKVASVTNGSGASGEFSFDELELAPTLGRVWVGYQTHTWSSTPYFDTTVAKTSVFNTSGGLIIQFGGAGYMRFSARTGKMLMQETFGVFIPGSSLIYVADETSRGKTLESSKNVKTETIRHFLTFYAGVFIDSTGSYIRVWDQSTLELLASYLISKNGGPACATVFKDGGGDSAAEYCGYTGGKWFTVSTRVSGVVPYADFESKSVAAAVRDLAIFAGCHFRVDQWGGAVIWARDSVQMKSKTPRELAEPPLENTFLPVWENFRSRITVSGKDEAGEDVEVTVGAGGDSAGDLSIDIPFPILSGYASAIGNAYLDNLGQYRTQREETIAEPEDGPIVALDRVIRDGRNFIALRVETNPAECEQTIVLVDEEGQP